MPNIGAPELLIILVVALIVFGPRKLPELGKSLGQGLREFRKTTGAVTDELRRGLDPAAPADGVPAPAPVLVASAPVPAAQLTPASVTPTSGPAPRA